METQSIAVMTLAVYAILTIVAAGDTKSAEAEEQDADLFCFSPITAGIFVSVLGRSERLSAFWDSDRSD